MAAGLGSVAFQLIVAHAAPEIFPRLIPTVLTILAVVLMWVGMKWASPQRIIFHIPGLMGTLGIMMALGAIIAAWSGSREWVTLLLLATSCLFAWAGVLNRTSVLE